MIYQCVGVLLFSFILLFNKDLKLADIKQLYIEEINKLNNTKCCWYLVCICVIVNHSVLFSKHCINKDISPSRSIGISL